MKRFLLWIAVLCLMLCAGTSSAELLRKLPENNAREYQGILSIRWQEKSWDWETGQPQKLELDIVNNADAAVPVELTLSDVMGGGRNLGQPYFAEKNKKRLKSADQGINWSGTLEAKEHLLLSVWWTPKMSLADVEDISIHVSASIDLEGVASYQSAAYRCTKKHEVLSASQAVLAGGVSMSAACLTAGGTAAVLLVLALLRRRRR